MCDFIPLVDDVVNPWMRRLLKEEALRCPECGAPQSSLRILSEDRVISPRYVVACGECKHRGAMGKDIMTAIKKWNKSKVWSLSDWFMGGAGI